MSRIRLTPAICRRQQTEIVIENFENANKRLRAHNAGRPIGPLTLMRAKKQKAICRTELLRRGIPKDDLDYEPATAEA
jgi:hypothetical protein